MGWWVVRLVQWFARVLEARLIALVGVAPATPVALTIPHTPPPSHTTPWNCPLPSPPHPRFNANDMIYKVRLGIHVS